MAGLLETAARKVQVEVRRLDLRQRYRPSWVLTPHGAKDDWFVRKLAEEQLLR